MGQIFRIGLLCLAILCIFSIGHGAAENPPTESECRPHIEKALKKVEGSDDADSGELIADIGQTGDPNDDDDDSNEGNSPNDAVVTDADSNEDNQQPDEAANGDDDKSDEKDDNDDDDSTEAAAADDNDDDSKEDSQDQSQEGTEADNGSGENDDQDSTEDDGKVKRSAEASDDNDDNDSNENNNASGSAEAKADGEDDDSTEDGPSTEKADSDENDGNNKSDENDNDADSAEGKNDTDDNDADSTEDGANTDKAESDENDADNQSEENGNDADSTEAKAETDDKDDDPDSKEDGESAEKAESNENDDQDSKEDAANDDDDDDDDDDSKEEVKEKAPAKRSVSATKNEPDSIPEDDLLIEYEKPKHFRSRDHIDSILHLDDSSIETEEAIAKAADATLKELKRIYENAIKPLETLYKYRDLSNRHFGDPEIFSKPLVLLMGPYSGGKSTIVNYLTDNEYTDNSLRTGAEPSPAYFNILMHGEKEEVLDGTQMAADWTFSGLQKFGTGLQDRLRGHKLPSKLLEKVNIVEIPGILEVRKQVSKLFPFNDACQWFIDRADIILLVYDPAKLDAGPETEAILDQLKGREYQTRIILNKGDQIKAEELLRVQGALIWNISPLMSSAQPPIMYTVSLWSHPFEEGAPIRLLQAHERALLQDLRVAINQRIDNKIASARRFAVRVRNHAKMVDCYLTTYYNNKGIFSNKKKVSGDIIENPQDYHIFEGLATLTNISRYDLPDPNAYREFFRLNPLYEFKKLSETCTYFRGCPINKLDIAIAYDLPELVGRNKKAVELALAQLEKNNAGNIDGGGSSSSNKKNAT